MKYSLDPKLVKRFKEEYAKEVEFWPEVYLKSITPRPSPTPDGPGDELHRRLHTMYEGEVPYITHWNLWIRPGINNHTNMDFFFHNYEHDSSEIRELVSAVIGRWPPGLTDTDREVWDRIGRVWAWLRDPEHTPKSVNISYLNPKAYTIVALLSPSAARA